MLQIISTQQLYRLFSKAPPEVFTKRCRPYMMLSELRALRDYMAQEQAVKPTDVVRLTRALEAAVITSPSIDNLNAALDLIKLIAEWHIEHGLALPAALRETETRLLDHISAQGADPEPLLAGTRGTTNELVRFEAAEARVAAVAAVSLEDRMAQAAAPGVTPAFAAAAPAIVGPSSMPHTSRLSALAEVAGRALTAADGAIAPPSPIAPRRTTETLHPGEYIQRARVMASRTFSADVKTTLSHVRAYLGTVGRSADSQSWPIPLPDFLKSLTLLVRTPKGTVDDISLLELLRRIKPKSCCPGTGFKKGRLKQWLEQVRQLCKQNGWMLSEEDIDFLRETPDDLSLHLLSPQEVKNFASSSLAVAAAAPPPLPAHAVDADEEDAILSDGEDADVLSLLRQRERRRRAPAAAMAAAWPQMAPDFAQLGSSPSIAHPWAVSAQPAMAAAWPQMAPGLAQLAFAAPTAPAASWDSVPLRPPSLDPAALGAAAAAPSVMVAASATDPGQSLQTPKNIQNIQNLAYRYFGSSSRTTLRSINILFDAIKRIPGISKDQVINFLRKMTFPVEATAGEPQEITFLELMHRAQPGTENYVGSWVSDIQKLFKDHEGSLSEQEIKFLTAKKPIRQPQLLKPKGGVYLPMPAASLGRPTGLAQVGSVDPTAPEWAVSAQPAMATAWPQVAPGLVQLRAVAASSEMPRTTPPAAGEAETPLSAADITQLRVITSRCLQRSLDWIAMRRCLLDLEYAICRQPSHPKVSDVLSRLTLPVRTKTGVVRFVRLLEVVRKSMPQSSYKSKPNRTKWAERVRNLVEEHGWKLSKREMAFLTKKPKGSPLDLLSPEEIRSLASSPLAVAAAAPPPLPAASSAAPSLMPFAGVGALTVAAPLAMDAPLAQPAMAAAGAAAPSGPPPPGGGGPSRSSPDPALPRRASRKRDRAPAESEPAAQQENPAKRAPAAADAAGHVATAPRASLVWQVGLASDSGSAYEDDSASSDTSSSP